MCVSILGSPRLAVRKKTNFLCGYCRTDCWANSADTPSIIYYTSQGPHTSSQCRLRFRAGGIMFCLFLKLFRSLVKRVWERLQARVTESKACIDRKFFHTHTPAAAIFYRIVTFSKCPLGLYRLINVVTAAYLIPLGIIKNVNIFNAPPFPWSMMARVHPATMAQSANSSIFQLLEPVGCCQCQCSYQLWQKVALAKFGTMLDQLMQTKEMMWHLLRTAASRVLLPCRWILEKVNLKLYNMYRLERQKSNIC